MPRQYSLISVVAGSAFYFEPFRPLCTPLYLQLRLFRQLTLDPNQSSPLDRPEPSLPTYGIITPKPPRSSLSKKTRTKPFVNFCWRLQTNYTSDLSVTSTSATERQPIERYLTISILHTLTFPPPLSKTTTRGSVLSTTEISRSRPWSIRSKKRLATPPQGTRHTPQPRTSP